MTAITQIPIEIWTQIFLIILRKGDAKDLIRCALVSKKWAQMVTPLIYREPAIHSPEHLWQFLAVLNRIVSLNSRTLRACSQNNSSNSSDTSDEEIFGRMLQCDHTSRRTFGELVRHLYLDNELVRPLMTPSLVRHLLDRCPNITRLDLNGCDRLDDVFFDNFHEDSSAEPGFLEIDVAPKQFIRSFTDKYTRKKSPLRHLQAICLEYCSLIPSDAICSLARQSAQSLRVINLNYCAKITNNALYALGNNCSRILGVSLNGCHDISDDGIYGLVSGGGPMSSLRELSLTDCTKLTDTSLLSISQFAPELTYLRLTCCRSMSPVGLVPLVQQCKKLEYLFLARCEVTDEVLLALAKEKTSLKYIDLAYAANISLEAVMHVVEKSENLELLGIGACKNIFEQHSWIKLFSQPVPEDVPEVSAMDYCVLRRSGLIKLKETWRQLQYS